MPASCWVGQTRRLAYYRLPMVCWRTGSVPTLAFICIGYVPQNTKQQTISCSLLTAYKTKWKTKITTWILLGNYFLENDLSWSKNCHWWIPISAFCAIPISQTHQDKITNSLNALPNKILNFILYLKHTHAHKHTHTQINFKCAKFKAR